MNSSYFWSSGAAANQGKPSYGDPLRNSANFSTINGAQPVLSRNFSTQGNLTKWTFSFWMKATDWDTPLMNILCQGTDGTNETKIMNSQQIGVGNNTYAYVATAGKLRDAASWYHVVVQWDTADAEPLDRVRIYINGVRQVGEFLERNNPPGQNFASEVGKTGLQYISGRIDPGGQNFFMGNLADIWMLDGLTVDPSEFGTYNSAGCWVYKEYTGSTGGTNSYNLKFNRLSDPDEKVAMGKDSSGKGNDFTCNGAWFPAYTEDPNVPDDRNCFSFDTPATPGWTGDRMAYMYPTNAYTVYGPNFEDTNRLYYLWCYSDQWPQEPFTILLKLGLDEVNHSNGFGLCSNNAGDNSQPLDTSTGCYFQGGSSSMKVYYDGPQVGTAPISRYSLVNIVIDPTAGEAGTLTAYNESGVAFDPPYNLQPGVQYAFFAYYYPINGRNGMAPYNYTFFDTKFNDSHNLDLAPQYFVNNFPEVAIYEGRQHFQPYQWNYVAGQDPIAAAKAATGFDHGTFWIVNRENNDGDGNIHNRWLTHPLRDQNLGQKPCYNPRFGTEPYNIQDQLPEVTSMVYSWKTDSSGLNKEAGHQALTYVPTGANQSIPHSLGKPPGFIIVAANDADPSGTQNWFACYHKDVMVDPSQSYDHPLRFDNDINGGTTNTGYFAATPTPTEFSVGPNLSLTENSSYNAWLWTDIPGYCKIGFYYGTGNSGKNNAFVYTGFKPQLIITRAASSSDSLNWEVWDNIRNPMNPCNISNHLDYNNGEYNGNYPLDIYTNGFKLTGGLSNYASNQRYVFIAWAENPFQAPANPRG